MVASIFARAVKKRKITSFEVRGDTEVQAHIIFDYWRDFKFGCNVELSIPDRDIHFVIEDFALRELQAQLQSVEIIGGLKTLLLNDNPTRRVADGPVLWPFGRPEWQQPSTAKRCTNQRLKDLGIWVVGSEHERDARRHLVQKVSSIL